MPWLVIFRLSQRPQIYFVHIHVSILFQGVDMITASKRLGHAQTSITMNIYGHMMQLTGRQAAGRIGNLFLNEKSRESIWELLNIGRYKERSESLFESLHFNQKCSPQGTAFLMELPGGLMCIASRSTVLRSPFGCLDQRLQKAPPEPFATSLPFRVRVPSF